MNIIRNCEYVIYNTGLQKYTSGFPLNLNVAAEFV